MLGFCKIVQDYIETLVCKIYGRGEFCDDISQVKSCKNWWIEELSKKANHSEEEKEELINYADEIQRKFNEGEFVTFQIEIALNAYKAAGLERTKEKLIAFGRSILLKNSFLLGDAVKAYEIVGLKAPADELIAHGKNALALEPNFSPLEHALKAFRMAGVKPSDELIAFADRLIKEFHLLHEAAPCDRPYQQALKALYVVRQWSIRKKD